MVAALSSDLVRSECEGAEGQSDGTHSSSKGSIGSITLTSIGFRGGLVERDLDGLGFVHGRGRARLLVGDGQEFHACERLFALLEVCDNLLLIGAIVVRLEPTVVPRRGHGLVTGDASSECIAVIGSHLLPSGKGSVGIGFVLPKLHLILLGVSALIKTVAGTASLEQGPLGDSLICPV